jgi:hypothetical protein
VKRMALAMRRSPFCSADVSLSSCENMIGREPDGARLRVWRAEQATDPYMEIVVEYNDQNKVARAYAMAASVRPRKDGRSRSSIQSRRKRRGSFATPGKL